MDGGRDIDKIPEALAKAEEILASLCPLTRYRGSSPKGRAFALSEEDEYILGLYDTFEQTSVDEFKASLRNCWGDLYDEYMEEYKVEEVLAGIYHGNGTDCTAEISKYLNKIITVGYNEQLDEIIEANDDRIGCVVVDNNLANLLQALMDKYTFEDVEGSWAKLCYYQQFFCVVTPH